MNKYDTMVTKNRQRSEEKIAQARKAIRELQMGQERITVPKLMKMTGLSRGFFIRIPPSAKKWMMQCKVRQD